MKLLFNPSHAELNPICQLLALLGAHPILHVSRIGALSVLKTQCTAGLLCVRGSWNTHTMNIATSGEIRTELFYSTSSHAARLQQRLREIEFRSSTDCTNTNQWRCHNCSCEMKAVEKLMRYIVLHSRIFTTQNHTVLSGFSRSQCRCAVNTVINYKCIIR